MSQTENEGYVILGVLTPRHDAVVDVGVLGLAEGPPADLGPGGGLGFQLAVVVNPEPGNLVALVAGAGVCRGGDKEVGVVFEEL
jgi:hypothetical protein